MNQVIQQQTGGDYDLQRGLAMYDMTNDLPHR